MSAFDLSNPAVRARLGVARADITPAPDAPINNWGAAPTKHATGIQAPMCATALAIGPVDSDETTVVIVTVDLGWFRTASAAAHVRDGIAARAGVPADRVLVALSHTHAGPAIDPDAVLAEDRSQVTGYLDRVVEAVGSAAARAIAGAVPAVLEWGVGTCTLARHRDHAHPTEHRTVCGYDPGGDADDTLLVGRIVDDAGSPIATLVNYACHPTTLGPSNTRISPDYVGAARDLVEDRTGVPMLFLQGASGELAPRRQYTDDTSAALANGRELGYAALSALEGMLPPSTRLVEQPTLESGAPLGIWQFEPVTVPTDVSLETHRLQLAPNASVTRWSASTPLPDAVSLERTARAALLAADQGGGPSIPLTVLRLGDAVLVATAGEAYSSLQRDLRAAFPDVAVVVVNLAGGAHAGYLPPDAAYASDRYQVWQTPAGRGSLEFVRDAATTLIRSHHAQPNHSR